MKPSNKKATNVFSYVRLKKYLSHYHKFTFKNPRKGKDFTPQQKSAITRQFNKLAEVIEKTRLEKSSFINTQKLKKSQIPKNDGIKTNKGFFFKYPYSSIKDVSLKKGEPKVKMIVTDFRLVKYSKFFQGTKTSNVLQIYIAIPEYIKTSMDAVADYVESLKNYYNPNYIMLNAEGRMYATQFNIKEFFSGSGGAVIENSDDDLDESHFFYAVLLGYFKK